MNKDTLYDKYGFTQWATIMSGNKTIVQYIDKFGINLFVNWETGDFSMSWNIPHSIFTMNCPECSPITDVAHFEKMYSSFRKAILSHRVR